MINSEMSLTSAGLREVLFDEITQLRAGKIDANRAQATAKLAQQVLNSVSLELAAARIIGNRSDSPDRKIPNLRLVG